MPEHCKVCDLKFEREPSFFYGSMYISYTYGVAVFVAVFVLVDLFQARLDHCWHPRPGAVAGQPGSSGSVVRHGSICSSL